MQAIVYSSIGQSLRDHVWKYYQKVYHNENSSPVMTIFPCPFPTTFPLSWMRILIRSLFLKRLGGIGNSLFTRVHHVIERSDATAALCLLLKMVGQPGADVLSICSSLENPDIWSDIQASSKVGSVVHPNLRRG